MFSTVVLVPLLVPLAGPFATPVVVGYRDLLTPLGFLPAAVFVVVFAEDLGLVLTFLLVAVCLWITGLGFKASLEVEAVNLKGKIMNVNQQLYFIS